jgi:hypothetical protein
MKIGEKKLTKGEGLKGSGGSGGAYTSKGSFLKAIAKKFGLGKRTSPQTKAEGAWKQSVGDNKSSKGLKRVEEYKGKPLDKKDLTKAQEKTRAKFEAEASKGKIAKERKAEQLVSDKKRIKRTARKVLKSVIVPALMASAYEVSERKKKK